LRATAAIDTGVVRLCNGRIDRRWSTYTGATMELYLGGNSEDCLTRKSPEYHLDYAARPLCAADLGDVSWSEARSGMGAAVIMEQRGPGVALRLHTVLAHDRPWMARQLEVTNTGRETVSITRAAADVLPVDPDRFRLPDRASRSTSRIAVRSQKGIYHYDALEGGHGTLLLGARADHQLALYAPNPRFCAPVWTGSVPLAPGKTWSAPPVMLYWAAGPPDDATSDELQDLHATWQRNSEPGLTGTGSLNIGPHT